MKSIISIDPGKSGGIAMYCNNVALAFPMPETEGDIISMLVIPNRNALQLSAERTAYVEEVGGYCGEGQPGSAMFKFGRNFGFILGALQALGWRIELVKPQRWQKFHGLGTKAGAGGKTAWKNKLKAHAQRLYPHQKVTLKTADALLILDYAIRQTEQGRVTHETALQAV